MHSREQKAALERLATDLRSIRTRAERTLTEVHEDTRIPLEVLRRLETDLLASDKMFNDVYIRSILRGFANAVDFPAEDVLSAFKEASAGVYGSGRRLVEVPQASSTEITDYDDPAPKPAADISSAEGITSDPDAETSVNPEQRNSDRPPAPKTADAPKKRFVLPKFDFRKGGIGILVLASVATGVFVIARLSGPDNPDSAIAASDVSTTVEELIPGARDGSVLPTESVSAQPFVMPDTINVSVFTTSGVFDPIRVRTDRDLRRPYWADSSDTLQFRFVNRIIVEDHLDRMAIEIEGLAYPVNAAASMLSIDRDDVREFLESRNSSGR
ncbi:MAG: hypothetical protein HKN43_14115 [Rhodothermales bacterium]|nr:hypothetical protein [Rhodothermales bacterium]